MSQALHFFWSAYPPTYLPYRSAHTYIIWGSCKLTTCKQPRNEDCWSNQILLKYSWGESKTWGINSEKWVLLHIYGSSLKLLHNALASTTIRLSSPDSMHPAQSQGRDSYVVIDHGSTIASVSMICAASCTPRRCCAFCSTLRRCCKLAFVV